MLSNDILTTSISYYSNKEDYCPQSITIGNVLESFKKDTYKERIKSLRSVLSTNEQSFKMNKGLLPAVTFSGEFNNGHKAENLLNYSRVIVIDIDKIPDEDIEKIRSKLLADKYFFAIWRSPSGKGLKALLYLEYDTDIADIPTIHKSAFRQVYSYLTNEYNIFPDASGSDVSRLCFISYDPDLIIKDDFSPFCVEQSGIERYNPKKARAVSYKTPNIINPIHYNSEGKNNHAHRNELRKIIRYLDRRKLSITGTYDDWYRVGYAIADTFSYDVGVKLYHKLSVLDGPKYDKEGCDRMLVYCYDNSKKMITFATIKYLAKLQGYRGSSQGG